MTLLRSVLIPAVLCLTLQAFPGQVKRQVDRRALDAYEQLREYKALNARVTHDLKARGLSASPLKPHIAINPSSANTANILFYDNMESGGNGWTTENYSGGPSLWHQTNRLSSSATYSWWAGSEATGDYRTGGRVNAAALTPVIDLSSAAAPLTLMFAENYETEKGWDYCMVDVSIDSGATWAPMRGGYGQAPSGSSSGWKITSLDLSDYAGQNVKIRFHIDTHDSLHNYFPGWFVDDVIIFDNTGYVQGHVFYDANQNGTRDSQEQGLKQWIVTADGPVTISVPTGAHGHYWLPLPLGTYVVTEQTQPGWTQTAPVGGSYTLALFTPDTLISTRHFGNFKLEAMVGGIVFNDANRNAAYDGGDSLMEGWPVVLTDTSDNVVDYDYSDSTGAYTLFAPAAGPYRIHQGTRTGWVQSLPATDEYAVSIPDMNTVLTGKDFGNYHSDSVQAILGWNFNDRDRDGNQSLTETGEPEFQIQLFRKNGTNKFHYWKQTRTDSGGFYHFVSLPPDTYKVAEIGRNGWWHSTPETTGAIPLAALEFRDSIAFGIYEITTSSVGGTVFNDANGNAAFDGGEPGLGNWRLNLTGPVSATVYSDSDGTFSFAGLWPGTYTVSEVWKGGYVQTAPPTPGVYTFFLGPEENRTAADFGNIDSNYTASFRTFSSDSLALAADAKGKHVPIAAKPNRAEFSVVLTNHSGTPAHQALVNFTKAPVFASLTSSAGAIELAGKANKITVTFSSPLGADSSIIISGSLAKAGIEGISLIRWVDTNGTKSGKDTLYAWLLNTSRLPMPNAVNAMAAVGTKLRVGLGGPHSMITGSYKDLVASLVEGRDRMQSGVPRCLDKFSGGASIKRQVKQLPPKKHNNKLLAEAIALQVNIRASLAGVTPAGLGGLVFDDPVSSPFNGMTLIEIANTLDSAMSSAKDTNKNPVCSMPSAWTGVSFDSLYNVLLRINGAFSGPMDTTSFSTGLHLTGVRPLSDVSFLRYDAAAAARAARLMENFVIEGEREPEQFSLYQNYPNPFNPVTTLRFDLPQSMIVTLKVYNMLGQEVEVLANREEMETGTQELQFDGSSLASGVYFYRIVAEPVAGDDGAISGTARTAIGKMLLVK